jgi:hypothetical protein
MIAVADMLSPVKVGNDAGWTLAFHKERPSEFWQIVEKPYLIIGRDDYYARVEAALPEGFAAGKYTFVVEGMTDGDYGKLAVDDVVRLYLYWRDTNASPTGYLANVAGLTDKLSDFSLEALKNFRVAELIVTKVSRKAGARRYEATIEARERAFMKLQQKVLQATLSAATFGDAAGALVENVSVPLELHGFTPSGTLPTSSKAHPGDDSVSFDPDQTAAHAMVTLGDAVGDVTEKDRRGMLLIRNGKLHLGPRRIPDPLRKPIALSHRNGLVEAVRDTPQREPSIDGDPPPPSHFQYRLTLKGRPDLFPGDVVTFRPAPEDLATTVPGSALGAVFAAGAGPLVAGEDVGDPVTLYVSSVEHKLGRSSAFVTTLTGITFAAGEDPWDDATTPAGTGPRGTSANTSVGTAKKIRSVAEDAAAAARAPEVGEVRAMTTSSDDARTEPPSQTLKLWRGLTRPDGRANQARRLDIRRKHPAVFEGVAYASPFAWGLCGLVLPRYPGTRVVMVHRNGEPRDPVEIGALWESGKGPNSEAGDWWLILPAGIPKDQRASVTDSETPQEDWLGTATNDLIDADGNRIIQVGELTVRVGGLENAGVRPERPDLKEGITIEHRDGDARITIDKNGKIKIEAKGDLELVSKQGNIKLEADQGSVNVSVRDAMDVN